MPTKFRVAKYFSASILLLAMAAVEVAAHPLFEIVNLGVLPGGTASRAHGINNLGQIAGQSSQTGGRTVSVLWENNVISRVIDMNATGLPGGYSGAGRAWNINDSGRVTGRLREPNPPAGTGYNVGYTWTKQDGFTILGVFGFNRGNAYEVNASGQVVGNARLPGDQRTRAFLWNPDGSSVHLGTIDPQNQGEYEGFDGNSFGTGVNRLGHATGSAGGTAAHQDDQAFFWSAGTGMLNLGTIDGFARSFGQSINDHDQIAGGMSNSAGTRWAITYWDRTTGVWHNLGTLGGAEGFGVDINNHTQIVGDSTTASGEERAFLWDRGQLYDLNQLVVDGSGWLLHEASGINDLGQIVGFGTFEGQERAFLLNPVPEPSSLALLALGGVGAVALRRRRSRGHALKSSFLAAPAEA